MRRSVLALILATSLSAAPAGAATTRTWKAGQTVVWNVRKTADHPGARIRIRVPKGLAFKLTPTSTPGASLGSVHLLRGSAFCRRTGVTVGYGSLNGTSFADALRRKRHPDPNAVPGAELGPPTATGAVSDTVGWAEFKHPLLSSSWVVYTISREISAPDPETGLRDYYGTAAATGYQTPCLTRAQVRELARATRILRAA